MTISKFNKLWLLAFLSAIIGTSLLAGAGAQIVKINVNDNWVFTDGTSYSVLASFDGRPDFANPNQLNAFQIEVSTNDSLFFLGAEAVTDDGYTLRVAITNFTLEHVLLSQRGAFLLYQSGLATIDASFATVANDTGTYAYNLYTMGQSPSVAVVNQEPVEVAMDFIIDQSVDPMNMNVTVIANFRINYVPSAEFTTTYNGTSVQAVNLTATVSMKALTVVIRGYGRPVELNTKIMEIQRTYALGIGLPISEKIVRYFVPSLGLNERGASLRSVELGAFAGQKLAQAGDVIERELKSYSVQEAIVLGAEDNEKSVFLGDSRELLVALAIGSLTPVFVKKRARKH